MKQFGQEVILTIEDANGRSILDASGLRVDFDIRQLDGFNRAAVTIYNLNEETIGNLIGGNNDHFATLRTRLHGKQEFVLMDSFFISNTIDEKKIPNTVTTLYCYDSIKKDVLEKQVNLKVERPSLDNMITQLLGSVGYTGKINYQCFPNDQQFYMPPRPRAQLNGSVSQCLSDMKREHGFNYYIRPQGMLFLYKPDLEQVPLTNLDELEPLVLQTENMRANPKLAPAQLQVTSNLDGLIAPGAIFDISELLTAGTNEDEQTLQLADKFATRSISGYSRYQTLTVQHKGSNYTDQWHTIATAVAPTKGKAMPTQTWWR